MNRLIIFISALFPVLGVLGVVFPGLFPDPAIHFFWAGSVVFILGSGYFLGPILSGLLFVFLTAMILVSGCWTVPLFFMLLVATLVPFQSRNWRKIRQKGFKEKMLKRQNKLSELIVVQKETAREKERLNENIAKIKELYELSKKMTTSLSSQAVCILACEVLSSSLSTTSCALFLPDGNWVYPQGIDGQAKQEFSKLAGEIGEKPCTREISVQGKPAWKDKSFLVPLEIQKENIGTVFVKGERDKLEYSALVLSSQIALGLEKAKLFEKVEEMSRVDGLTELYLYRYFRQRLDEEIVRSQRYSTPFSLLILDIDHFKRYNDTYGHPAGDEILKTLAGLIRSTCHSTDFVARYGGEEFAIIMPGINPEDAVAKARELRKVVEKYKFERESITVSIGIAHFPGDSRTAKDLIEKADQALYRAKQQGRNRVREWTPPTSPR